MAARPSAVARALIAWMAVMAAATSAKGATPQATPPAPAAQAEVSAAQVTVPPAPAPAPLAPGETQASVQQPRAFGYQIGDVLLQRVLLEAGGEAVQPLAVPQRERLGAYFERRSAWIESAEDGRRWLNVEYQLINVPVGLLAVSLPQWRLALEGASGASLRVAAWPLSVAPLTSREAFDIGELGRMRPDRGPPMPGRGVHERALRLALGALDATLLAWLGWWFWRNWRATTRLPFARAARSLRGLDEASPQAWQIVHAAFDQAGGRVTQMATLPALFVSAPYLAAARPRIETFYAQSRELFFGAGLPAGAISVRALCSELRRLERRHER